MKIREGAYYRTRGGQVFGPTQRNATGDGFKYYHEDGSFVGAARVMDLISKVYVSDTPPAENAPETKTLRDEFADTALKAMLGHSDYVELSPAQMAVEAYRQADAMMEARKK